MSEIIRVSIATGKHQGRRVSLQNVWADGSVFVRAQDLLKPAEFMMKGGEFPWKQFLPLLYHHWTCNAPVPFAFRLQRRIPVEVMETLMASSLEDQFAILKGLRQNGYLLPLSDSPSL